MEYRDYVYRLNSEDRSLAHELADFTSLEHVLAWLQRTGRPMTGMDVLAQDEFCHDLLLPLADGHWLVFGMT